MFVLVSESYVCVCVCVSERPGGSYAGMQLVGLG